MHNLFITSNDEINDNLAKRINLYLWFCAMLFSFQLQQISHWLQFMTLMIFSLVISRKWLFYSLPFNGSQLYMHQMHMSIQQLEWKMFAKRALFNGFHSTWQYSILNMAAKQESLCRCRHHLCEMEMQRRSKSTLKQIIYSNLLINIIQPVFNVVTLKSGLRVYLLHCILVWIHSIFLTDFQNPHFKI